MHPDASPASLSTYNVSDKMPSLSARSIYLFGLTSFIAGIFSLLKPASFASAMDFPAVCLPVARGNSMAAIAMGIYYTFAAYQENRGFFVLTVPMRLLTTAIFWSQGWTTPAIWEGAGAVLTFLALAYDRSARVARTNTLEKDS